MLGTISLSALPGTYGGGRQAGRRVARWGGRAVAGRAAGGSVGWRRAAGRAAGGPVGWRRVAVACIYKDSGGWLGGWLGGVAVAVAVAVASAYQHTNILAY